MYAHGVNIGHGYVKYLVLNDDGCEQAPVIFPALLAPAGRHIVGQLVSVATVSQDGQEWWVGDDALLSPALLSLLSQDRLTDPTFIPALLRHARRSLNGAARPEALGSYVTGLPATWATSPSKAQQLGARIRDVVGPAPKVRVIPEPVGLIYAALLDAHGQVVGDPALAQGQIAVVDLGHHTVDIASVQALRLVPSSLDTWTLGTAGPLKQLRARLSAYFERELTLLETDRAIRNEGVTVAGHFERLPADWARPLSEHAKSLTARLVEAWGRGAQFDRILIGGGGAALAPLAASIAHRFPHAVVVNDPQLAIARGYARLARRLSGETT